MIAVLLDLVLGRRCRLGCGQRVFARDVAEHERREHDGDPDNDRASTAGGRR